MPLSSEGKNSQRSLPLALIGGVVIVLATVAVVANDLYVPFWSTTTSIPVTLMGRAAVFSVNGLTARRAWNVTQRCRGIVE